MCRQYYSLLHPAVSTLFGILFVLTSIFAAGGNTLAAYILWRKIKRRKNLLLKSLVFGDALTGYLSAPLFAIQLFVTSRRFTICTLQYSMPCQYA